MPDKEMLLKPRDDPQVYTIFCVSFLACLVGKIIFNQKVLTEPIANFVTISDEAYALVYLENSYDRWMAESKDEPTPPTKKWTSDNLAATIYKGWNKEGIVRYNELYKSVKEKRKEKGTKKFELDFQERMQASREKKGRKRKEPLENENILEPLFEDSDAEESDDDDERSEE